MTANQAVVKRGERDKELSHDPRRLRRRRTAAGLGLVNAAKLAGYSPAHLSMLEHGHHHGASPECLKSLAQVYGCEITDLMPAEGYEHSRDSERVA
jgi:transcriptional regulator with XRE-family HTH domain